MDLAALPLCISPEVAETILFVGKAVWLLKHPAGAFEGQELLPIRYLEEDRGEEKAAAEKWLGFKRGCGGRSHKALAWHCAAILKQCLCSFFSYYVAVAGLSHTAHTHKKGLEIAHRDQQSPSPSCWSVQRYTRVRPGIA